MNRNKSVNEWIFCLIFSFTVSSLVSWTFYISRVSINNNFAPVDCFLYEYAINDEGTFHNRYGDASEIYDTTFDVNIKGKNLTIEVRGSPLIQNPISEDLKKYFRDKYPNLPMNHTCYKYDSSYYGEYTHLNEIDPLISACIFTGLMIVSLGITYLIPNSNYENIS